MSGRPILQLYTTMVEFETLHERARSHAQHQQDGQRRSPGAHPYLMDHALMLEALRKSGRVDVAEPR